MVNNGLLFTVMLKAFLYPQFVVAKFVIQATSAEIIIFSRRVKNVILNFDLVHASMASSIAQLARLLSLHNRSRNTLFQTLDKSLNHRTFFRVSQICEGTTSAYRFGFLIWLLRRISTPISPERFGSCMKDNYCLWYFWFSVWHDHLWYHLGCILICVLTVDVLIVIMLAESILVHEAVSFNIVSCFAHF